MGIEPTSRAWEARILPMNYARGRLASRQSRRPIHDYAIHLTIFGASWQVFLFRLHSPRIGGSYLGASYLGVRPPGRYLLKFIKSEGERFL